MFYTAYLVVTCLAACGAPGHVVSREPLQYQVERKVCGQVTRIKLAGSEALGQAQIVCSR